MSNPIYIVDLSAAGIDLPADDLTALWSQIQPLLESGSPSPRYVAFGKALVSKVYRLLSGAMDLKEVKAGLDDPEGQARTLETAASAFALPAELGGLDEGQLLHLVVHEAMKRDLLVFADHLGVAFLPGGEIVSAPGSDVEWSLLLEEPVPMPTPSAGLTRLQMVDRVVQMLGDKLKPHGFAQVPGRPCEKDGDGGLFVFSRELPEGPQFIQLSSRILRYEGLKILFTIIGRNNYVHPILCKALPERAGSALQPYAESYSIRFPSTRVFRAWSGTELFRRTWPRQASRPEFAVQPEGGPFPQQAMESLVGAVVRAAVPILDTLVDLQGIQSVFLHEAGNTVEEDVKLTADHALTAIVAGYLLDDPALDRFARTAIALVADDPQAGEDVKDWYANRVHRLLAFLKANVQPLNQ